MTLSIRVETKVMGQKRMQIPESVFTLPSDRKPDGAPLTLRDLITRIVLEEVAAFRQRQEERRLLRVLTEAEIARFAKLGKVNPGGQDIQQEVDLQEAVKAALQAFEDGLYYVFIDGVQQRSLDDPVRIREDSRILFVRLVPLVGG